MSYITGFVKFWYDFIVGDDWTVAAGVVIALIITAALAHNGVAAWWLMPLAAVALLAGSLLRAARS